MAIHSRLHFTHLSFNSSPRLRAILLNSTSANLHSLDRFLLRRSAELDRHTSHWQPFLSLFSKHSLFPRCERTSGSSSQRFKTISLRTSTVERCRPSLHIHARLVLASLRINSSFLSSLLSHFRHVKWASNCEVWCALSLLHVAFLHGGFSSTLSPSSSLSSTSSCWLSVFGHPPGSFLHCFVSLLSSSSCLPRHDLLHRLAAKLYSSLHLNALPSKQIASRSRANSAPLLRLPRFSGLLALSFCSRGTLVTSMHCLVHCGCCSVFLYLCRLHHLQFLCGDKSLRQGTTAPRLVFMSFQVFSCQFPELTSLTQLLLPLQSRKAVHHRSGCLLFLPPYLPVSATLPNLRNQWVRSTCRDYLP